MFIIIVFILFFLPYFILGQNSYIEVFDNLYQINMQGIFDGKMQAHFFPSLHNPEFTLPGTHQVFHLAHLKLDKLFFAFDYLRGFVFNEIFFRLFAFLGMFFLLADYQPAPRLSRFGLAIVSLLFTTLPFWSQGNLSIAGIPLLIWAFLNLQQKRKILLSELIFLFFAFYSNFFFTGIYLLATLVIAILFLIKKQKANRYLGLALLIYLSCSIFSEYPVFWNELILKIPTNRSDQYLIGLDFWHSFRVMIHNIFRSYRLSACLQTAIILPSSFLITLLVWYKKDKIVRRRLLPFWIALILLSVFYGFFYWQPVLDLYNHAGLGLRFDRLYVFNPVFWFLLWAGGLGWFSANFSRISRVVLPVLFSVQLMINFSFYTVPIFTQHPNFQQFMSTAQFNRIRAILPEEDNDFRVGCSGFYPAVANFNGFKTIDSFSAYYPLSYKNRFRKIIARELTQNQELAEYFANKGSALYLFDDAIARTYDDQNYIRENFREVTCDLDFAELSSLGVKYLFSTVRIGNYSALPLQEIYAEDKPEDYYRMYVYKIVCE